MTVTNECVSDNEVSMKINRRIHHSLLSALILVVTQAELPRGDREPRRHPEVRGGVRGGDAEART